MIRFIEDHPAQVQALVITELSRLGRSFYETLDIIRSIEEDRGIPVISLSPNESFLRSMDPGIRRPIIGFLAWVHEKEREDLIQRTRQALQARREAGQVLGRPRRDLPWKQIDKYRDKGLSYSAISRLLDIPYSTLIKKSRARRIRQEEEDHAARLQEAIT